MPKPIQADPPPQSAPALFDEQYNGLVQQVQAVFAMMRGMQQIVAPQLAPEIPQ